MSIQVREIVSTDELKRWDRLVYDSTNAGYQQYSSWLQSYCQVGYKRQIFGIFDQRGKLQSGVGLLILPIPIIGWNLACSPFSPVIPTGTEEIFASAWVDMVRQWRNSRLVQIHFQTLEEKNETPMASLLDNLGATLRSTFKGVTMGNKGMCIELKDRESEDVLNSFRQQTRYEIRRGLKSGIEVKSFQSVSEIQMAWNCLNQNAVSMRVPYRPRKMFVDPALELIRAGHATMLSGYQGKKLLGVAFGIMTKNRMKYFASVRTKEGIKSEISYVLLWKLIEVAIENGCAYVDLGGATNQGVETFKRGFRARHYCLTEPRSVVFNQNLMNLYSRIEPKLRKHRYRVAEFYRWVINDNY
jgi:lipid II:glycine glycyltransferase (peptidoglycan interpeptide bridge formation enzyme)